MIKAIEETCDSIDATIFGNVQHLMWKIVSIQQRTIRKIEYRLQAMIKANEVKVDDSLETGFTQPQKSELTQKSLHRKHDSIPAFDNNEAIFTQKAVSSSSNL